MITYNITFNEDLASVVDKEMKRNKYGNRSEFFRDLVRKVYIFKPAPDYVIEELNESDEDYKLMKSRQKRANFIPLDKMLKQK
jgi:Arc/MetJ-type ribon-helix-helix transcriptional regulator